MTSLVQYGSYDLDAAERDAADAASLGGDMIMDLEPGDNIVRFLPPKVGMRSPLRMTALHYIEIPGLQQKFTYACPRVELKLPCEACAQAQRLAQSKNPIDREMSKRFLGKLRIYSRVVNRSIAELELALRILPFGKSVHNQLKAIRKNPRLGGDFTDPTAKGFDIVINRDGTGLATKYNVVADRQSSPLAPSEELMMWLIENQPDVERYIDPTMPDELSRIWKDISVVGRATSDVHRIAPPAQPAPSTAAEDVKKAAVTYDENFNVIPDGSEDDLPF